MLEIKNFKIYFHLFNRKIKTKTKTKRVSPAVYFRWRNWEQQNMAA